MPEQEPSGFLARNTTEVQNTAFSLTHSLTADSKEPIGALSWYPSDLLPLLGMAKGQPARPSDLGQSREWQVMLDSLLIQTHLAGMEVTTEELL